MVEYLKLFYKDQKMEIMLFRIMAVTHGVISIIDCTLLDRDQTIAVELAQNSDTDTNYYLHRIADLDKLRKTIHLKA